MIALLDYGAGNLTSVRKALTAVGADFSTPAAPGDLAAATAIVIPGVGHFGATRAITAEWREAILSAVSLGTPLLGICLGLQYLFDGSDEAPELSGLGLFKGRCTLLPPRVKVPHVGWNSLSTRRRSLLLDGIKDGTQVYFTHSFAAPITRAAAATTEHGARFASVVEHERVFGVQFHPEKSSDAGLRVLRSFVEISKFPNPQISK
ncbi:MAG TPA: imidazole glycerol phosphate synthase subunit HisH [Vicinamibacterales bacterium]|nr:imidazole glycerol phosphate synthase subunit HisH [Vicinamibacterales bacterium]